MNITIIGAGYVGQVVSASLASLGHDVTVYDIDRDKLESIAHGDPTIHEPGLDDLIEHGVENDTLRPEQGLQTAVDVAKTVFLCVGTPPDDDGSVNLDYHYAAVEELKPFIDDQTVIIKSTVPPGTAEETRERLNTTVLNNPEFLKEGSAVDDFLNPDRVVIGANVEQTGETVAKNVYKDVLDDAELFVTGNESAELIKYASNAFLATKISYANELARLCDHIGADVDDVTTGMALDERIQDAFFGAGVGYGGSCFPKDTKALIDYADGHGEAMHIVRSTERVNHEQRERVISRVKDELGGLDDTTIGVWGVAFKPDTDDIRGSPATTIVETLRGHGARIKVYDPAGLASFRERVGDTNVSYEDTKEDAANHTDALLLLTAWDEFKDVDIDEVDTGVVYDGRNIYAGNDYDTDVIHVGKH